MDNSLGERGPHSLRKAASTTFQAFSNSIRSKAHLLYAANATQSRDGKDFKEEETDDSRTWSPKKRFLYSRALLADTFTNSGHSPKKRAGYSPRSSKDTTSDNEEFREYALIPLDPFASSLNVQSPDHILSVSQPSPKETFTGHASEIKRIWPEMAYTLPEFGNAQSTTLSSKQGYDPAKVDYRVSFVDPLPVKEASSSKPRSAEAISGSSTASPLNPSMGSPTVWKQARADRDQRYREITAPAQDVDTTTDTESDPGLALTPSPRRAVQQYPTRKTFAVNFDCFPTLEKPIQHPIVESNAFPVFEKPAQCPFDHSDAIDSDLFPSLDFSTMAPRFLVTMQRPLGGYFDELQPSALRLMVEAIDRKAGTSLPKGEVLEKPVSHVGDGDEFSKHTLDEAPLVMEAIYEAPSTPSCSGYGEGVGKEVAQGTAPDKASLFEPSHEEPSTASRNGKILPYYEAISQGSPSSCSISTDGSCAITTHDALCYAPPPWPSVHIRKASLPEQDDAEIQANHGESLNHFSQSPWSTILFDEGITKDLTPSKRTQNLEDFIPAEVALPPSPFSEQGIEMKHTLAPLTPYQSRPSIVEPPKTICLDETDHLKMTINPLSLEPKAWPPTSAVSTIAPIESRFHQEPTICAFNGIPGKEKSDELTRILEFPLKDQNREFVAAKLPSFGLPQTAYSPPSKHSPSATSSPSITSSPPKGRRVTSKAKRLVRRRPALGEASGNAVKAYSCSQVVKAEDKFDELQENLDKFGRADQRDSVIGKWGDKEKKAVAMHLMGMVYGLEEEAKSEMT